ncbi:MAG TPA: hypothetical protein DHV59_16955 [Oxalobacteraceae bacterium]|nr:hypothetical protein [Oxalobacteraceae bacterium]
MIDANGVRLSGILMFPNEYTIKPHPDKLSRTTSQEVVRMKTLIALVVLASCMAGCAVYTPSGSVVIDPAGPQGAGNGKFCPPGQAKKGNC